MAEGTAHEIFLYPGFWVLRWPSNAPLETPIHIEIDGCLLKKPYIGITSADHAEHIVGGITDKALAENGIPTVRILNENGDLLDEFVARTSKGFTLTFFEQQSLKNRERLRRAFIKHLKRDLPGIWTQIGHDLMRDLLEPHIVLIPGPGGLLYVQYPLHEGSEPGHIPLEGAFSSPASLAPKPIKVSGFQDAKHLHLLIEGVPSTLDQSVNVELSDQDERPFLLEVPKGSRASTDRETWLHAIRTQAGPHAESLEGLLQDEWFTPPEAWLEGLRDNWLVGWADPREGDPGPVELQVTLDGVTLHERLRADLPFQGHPPSPNGFGIELPKDALWGGAHVVRLHDARFGTELAVSPYLLGATTYDGDFILNDEGILEGWVSPRALVPLGGNETLLVLMDGHASAPLRLDFEEMASEGCRGRATFRVLLPDALFDTEPHAIEIAVLPDGPESRPHVLRRTLEIEASYRGQIELLYPERVLGWIVNSIAPKRPVKLEVRVNGTMIAQDLASLPRDIAGEPARIGFDFLPNTARNPKSRTYRVGLYLAGTDIEPLGSGNITTPHEIAIQSLTTILQDLRAKADESTEQEDIHLWTRIQVLEPLITALREAGTLETELTLDLDSNAPAFERRWVAEEVSVLMPVYKDETLTLRCLESVLDARNEHPYHLTVVSDGSPEASLIETLRKLSTHHGFTFIDRKQNLGFVKTVNRHLEATGHQDVVLLNSDTVVADGWLDRLRAAAYQAPNIGTVTPLSNNATLCSFPSPFAENPLPMGFDVGAIDREAAKVNPGQIIDLPTGVGFCFYLRRAMLDEVGLLDEVLWGKGYGEENDLCLRASRKGWRNVAACDVFVYHEGGASFGAEKEALIAANLQKLHALYPDYDGLITRFEVEDPLKATRDRLAIALFRQRGVHPMLYVAHALGGGTERALRDLGTLLHTEGTPVFVLRALERNRWRLESLIDNVSILYEGENLLERVVDDLKTLGIRHVHYHQTLGFGPEIWALPTALGVAYDITLHDYLPLCPKITLMDSPDTYCGERQFDLSTCERCIKANPLDPWLESGFEDFGGTASAWRESHKAVLQAARKCFAPSDAASAIYLRHLPELRIETQIHPEPPRALPEDLPVKLLSPLCPESPLKVLVLGGIGDSKGFVRFKAMVHDAALRGLPIQFEVMGYTRDDQAFAPYDNIRILGSYDPYRVIELIGWTECRLALFLSPWPETWSYTLSEVWAAGVYPVALDMGAIGQRIREKHCGDLHPIDTPASALNDALLARSRKIPHFDPKDLIQRGIESDFIAQYYGL